MYLSHFQTLQSWLSCCRTALEAFLCSLLFCIQNQSDESPLQCISYLVTNLKSAVIFLCTSQEHILFCYI